MQHEIKIADTRPWPASAPGRVGQHDTIVFFSCDGHPTSLTIFKDNPSLDEVKRAIEKFVDGRDKIVGHTYKIG